MKNLLLILSIFIFTGCNPSSYPDDREKNYCGPVIHKGYQEPTSGYKSHRDAVYYLIINDTECRKFIRVHVTVPTYYEAVIGKNVCFTLSGYDLKSYNNSDGKHLK